MQIDRRKYFRIQLKHYLKCMMSVSIIGEKFVDTEKTNALIENIGPGGLKILSDLMLPVKPDVIFSFDTKILGENIEVLGHIVWQQELPGGMYQYGVKMVTDEASRDVLTKLLMKFAARLRQGSFPYDDSFVEDYAQFFRENKKNKPYNLL